MAIRLEMPALGQSMEEGTITKWFKSEGQSVEQGEPLFEVMTDKANIEQEAPQAGILRRILVAADQTVPIRTPIGIIATADEPIEQFLGFPLDAAAPSSPGGAASTPTIAPARAASTSSTTPLAASPRARRIAAEIEVDLTKLAGLGTGPNGRIVSADVLSLQGSGADTALAAKVKASPLAFRLAQAHGISLEEMELEGSGAHGKVVSEDVIRAIDSSTKLAAQTDEIEVIALAGMRKLIADNVSHSAQSAPHVTLTVPVDMSEAVRLRKQILPPIEKSHRVRVTFTDIIAKAVASTLGAHPRLNSTLIDNKITMHHAVHLGMAVSLGNDGLVVPVVRNAHNRGIAEIAFELRALATKARDGKLLPDEMNGGTFSITNLGTYGIDLFNPIINPPQCAILGICAIVERPVVVDSSVVVRPMMNLCLSFDHRITDGAPASAFLAQLKQVLENPYLMMV